MSLEPKFQRQFFNAPEHLMEECFVLQPSQAQKWEYEQLLAPLKSYSQNSTNIFEVGCGSGRVTFELLRRGYNVTAYDISERPLALLHKRYLETKRPSWGALTTTTTLKKKPFADVLIGADILHHVQLASVLPQWVSQIKEGGIALFTEPNAYNPLWYLHFLMQRIPWNVEAGIVQCRPEFLSKIFLNYFSSCRIEGHGLIPPVIFQPNSKFAKYNATQLAKKFPWVAFRLQVFAQL